jgi:fumarylacetoacetase
LAESEEEFYGRGVNETGDQFDGPEQELMDRFSNAEWGRTSWVDSANDAECGFPLQSLPYCIFAGENGRARVGVGIGAFVLDLQHLSRSGILEGLSAEVQAACLARVLNPLMACETTTRRALRRRLMDLLDSDTDQATRDAVDAALTPMADATLLKPVEPANFTDFYASIHHATNVGKLFRPEQPLLPNYKYLPIGYHGRASSIVVSGTPIRRPQGQTKPVADGIPGFGPTRFLDYEVEVGMYVGTGNPLGEPLLIGSAGERIFGLSLVNDWSARDIQSWEYQPLGPFLAKSFATSVSPWVIPMDALVPFRVSAAARSAGDPAPLPYLNDEEDQEAGAIDLTVEAFLRTAKMRDVGCAPYRLSHGNMRNLYWTPAQMIAHHTCNGCNFLPGDLIATGTVSGAEKDAAGCLLELTQGGAEPILLPNGESRVALEDGDEVILHGSCRREGFPLISLGECRGVVMQAK